MENKFFKINYNINLIYFYSLFLLILNLLNTKFPTAKKIQRMHDPGLLCQNPLVQPGYSTLFKKNNLYIKSYFFKICVYRLHLWEVTHMSKKLSPTRLHHCQKMGLLALKELTLSSFHLECSLQAGGAT